MAKQIYNYELFTNKKDALAKIRKKAARNRRIKILLLVLILAGAVVVAYILFNSKCNYYTYKDKVLIYGVRSAVQYQGNQKMQEVFRQQEMTDAKNVTGAQQGEKETDTVSKIETTQNSENEVVSDEKAGSSEISEESNSESAVQDTEASETQTTEKTQQTWGSIGGYYTVKRGDTLAGISKKMYQSYNYIEMIAEANGIDNVDEIYPGQILEIPQIED